MAYWYLKRTDMIRDMVQTHATWDWTYEGMAEWISWAGHYAYTFHPIINQTHTNIQRWVWPFKSKCKNIDNPLGISSVHFVTLLSQERIIINVAAIMKHKQNRWTQWIYLQKSTPWCIWIMMNGRMGRTICNRQKEAGLTTSELHPRT